MLTFSAAFALFFSMVVLAIIPGPGILVVVSRTLAGGLKAGLITSLGIVAGDYVFIALAIAGLSAIATHYETLFLAIRYLGAAYLCFLGLSVLFKSSNANKPSETEPTQASLNFIAGLLTTLSNPKAILFYVSFFPAFVDLQNLNAPDILAILVITFMAVGSVMAGYAYLTFKSQTYSGSGKWEKPLRLGSGVVLIACGVFIALN